MILLLALPTILVTLLCVPHNGALSEKAQSPSLSGSCILHNVQLCITIVPSWVITWILGEILPPPGVDVQLGDVFCFALSVAIVPLVLFMIPCLLSNCEHRMYFG
jgi:hypothetical protein